MKLTTLIEELKPLKINGHTNIEITGISHDSRKTQPGDLFVAIRGLNTDGTLYIEDAHKRGAAAIITEVDGNYGLPTILVENARQALACAGSWFYYFPERKLKMVGITGTNGKTTTSYLIKSILEKNSFRTGLVGSIVNMIGDKKLQANYTTPDSVELMALLAQMVEDEIQYAVLEISSHALALERVSRCIFDKAVFTNLTHDHLDFHKNINNYKEAKSILFNDLLTPDGVRIINYDDEFGQQLLLANNHNSKTNISYGLNAEAQVRAERIDLRFDGTSFYLTYGDICQHIELPLIGMFNVYNTLAAVAYALSEGIDLEVIVEAIEEFPGVAGRLQMIDCGQDFYVIVDYAHTPDSLEQVLKTVQALTNGRLITVFGCTGDRDVSKRAKMGELAAQWSDYFYITSDDPHSEDPMAIIKDIERGAIERGSLRRYDYQLEVNRYRAIESALSNAGAKDVVLIAGKGHETVQVFKDKRIEFSDEKVVREILTHESRK